jgi:formiminotetrahydrofolate cyclodeaminase
MADPRTGFEQAGLDLPVRDFLAAVAAPTPTATGGAVCAVTAASAAGLASMAAQVSKMDGSARAEELRARLEELAIEDTRVYAAVTAAQRRTDPSRTTALRAALAAAAEPPMRIAHVAADTAKLCAELASGGKRSVRGDAATGAALAAAAARSAVALARLNLVATPEPPEALGEAERAAASASQAAEAALAAAGA